MAPDAPSEAPDADPPIVAPTAILPSDPQPIAAEPRADRPDSPVPITAGPSAGRAPRDRLATARAAALAAGSRSVAAQTSPPVRRSRRYRLGQVLGTTVLVVLVAVIGYVTFATAARLGEPANPSASAADASPALAATDCERAVGDVIDHPELAVLACSSQTEVDAAYRAVFQEPPQWGSTFRDACVKSPALRSRPLCATPSAPPTEVSDQPSGPPATSGRSAAPSTTP